MELYKLTHKSLRVLLPIMRTPKYHKTKILILTSNIKIKSRFTKRDYLQTVEQLKEHIQKGDIFEINLCQEFFINNFYLFKFTTVFGISLFLGIQFVGILISVYPKRKNTLDNFDDNIFNIF